MKYFLIVCLVLVSAITASAQKDFEGMIKYRIITPSSEGEKGTTDSLLVTVFFAPQKILMKTNMGFDKGEESDILVLLDSAKVYTIDTKEKTYRVKKLRESVPLASAGKEIIAGYSGTPVQYEGNKIINMLRGNTTLWFADELIFTVPQKYEGNEELILISKNHILLKAIISMNMDFGYDMSDEDQTNIPKSIEASLIATEIISSPQNPVLFTIPKEFIKQDRYSSINDTITVMMDTAVMAPMPPPPPHKKAPPKKAPVKQPVKTAPAKKPIRKEN